MRKKIEGPTFLVLDMTNDPASEDYQEQDVQERGFELTVGG